MPSTRSCRRDPDQHASVFFTTWEASDSRAFTADDLVKSPQVRVYYDWDFMALKLRDYLRSGMVCDNVPAPQPQIVSLVARVEMKDGTIEEYVGSSGRLWMTSDSCHKPVDQKFRELFSRLLLMANPDLRPR